MKTGLQVYERAVADIEELLHFPMNGSYTKRSLASLLVEAACREVSLTQASRDLPTQMAESNARYHLSKLDREMLLAQGNALLLRYASGVLSKPLLLAADLNEIPYYGEPEMASVRGGKHKQGTDYFHTYASLYVIVKGRRFTLASRSVVTGDPLEDVLQDMLRAVLRAGLRIACLFLDRGFYSGRVMRMLQAMGIPFCMPATNMGRSKKLRDLERGPSRRVPYTIHSRRYTKDGGTVTEEATYTLVIVRCTRCKKEDRKVHHLLYATWRCPFGSARIKDVYRKRFGIESSFRQMNDARARTSTRDPIRRMLFVLVGFLLLNLWTYIKWTMRDSSGTVGFIRGTQFTFEPLLVLLSTVLGLLYGRFDILLMEKRS